LLLKFQSAQRRNRNGCAKNALQRAPGIGPTLFWAIWPTGAVSTSCRSHIESIREPISFHLSFHLHASPFILIHAVTLRSLSENADLRGCAFIPLQSSPSLARLINDFVFDDFEPVLAF
jgi:hypothetical protein